MSISQISVVIMAKNADETIAECLDALKDFDEVILYLNNSSDNTETIAIKYSNANVVKGEFIGFGQTKNKAVECSTNEWILSLDSDEILNKNLVDEIRQLDTNDIQKVYKLKRDNYFLGHKTQSQDIITRIYNKNFTQFNENKVHEKIIIPNESNTITLKNSFKHVHISDPNQTLTKIIKYTDLSAKDKKVCFFAIVIIKSLFAFFKTYIIKGNVLKGWVGCAFSISVANERYYKYLKMFIHCQNKKDR